LRIRQPNNPRTKNRRLLYPHYPQVLWDQCFALDPNANLRFARGVWEHQIADHQTGNFNRHAGFDRHGPERDKEFPHHAGFYIMTWGAAYLRTKDPVFVQASDVLLNSFERRREPNGRFPSANPRSDLSWAIDVWDASSLMPDEKITVYPGVYGEVISLLTAACRITGQDRFARRADVLADEAIRLFWQDGPLPRTSSRHDHYEAITRADTPALVLLELWSIHQRLNHPLVFSWIDR